MAYFNLIHGIGNKAVFIVSVVIICALIIDTSLIKIYSFLTRPYSPDWNVAIFIVMALVYAIGQYVILEFVKTKIKQARTATSRQSNITVIHKVVSTIQYILIALLVLLVLEMIITSSYNVSILTAAIGFSYILAIMLMALLAKRFFSWFKSNHNLVVLTYAISISLLSINALLTLVYVDNILIGQPNYMLPHIGHISPFDTSNPELKSGYIISSVVAFMATWFATVLLMRHYSHKLGRVKYWIIVGMPLAYFLSQFEPLFLSVFYAYRLSEPVLFGIVYTLIFNLSKPAGGILFGVAFWTVSRTIGPRPLKDYVLIAAYGFVLVFTSNQAIVLVNSAYPPFGLATISFMGLSSYLIFQGIYASAISVSEDNALRKTIRKSVEQQSRLLDSIGTAHMEQEIQKKVISITKEHQDDMMSESGVQPSLSEDDIKQYLQEVIQETKKDKNKLLK